MKKSIVAFAKQLLQRFGYVVSDAKWAFCDPLAEQRRMVGEDARVILDVGANKGDTVQTYLDLFPRASIYAFEPTPSLVELLRKRFQGNPRVTVIDRAVSHFDGKATFTCTSKDIQNSLLKLSGDYNGTVEVETQEVQTTTIDRFCQEYQLDKIDILKMDIQGAEKFALEGASACLSDQRIGLVYSELQFTPIYAGQTRPEEIIAALAAKGYRLYGFFELSRASDGCLDFCNGLFFSDRLRQSMPRHYLY